ncbi:acyl-CoA dehydrogenase family protein [Blastococcus sp. BMG 814]|uniref:Acyl-CoA dehydrogenase family protein n=1 Tax=Blastococcus carthaginiensis TaxID=3050034 RepID=A0ABT9IE84_9ACTN|nr:acyl-CoA dehydrogenase family protein [Blastococcus carthaginiensis]MDP5183885.1 acyl-CoA dehydrogenase family protein [Blastococcus carthaginiensis]
MTVTSQDVDPSLAGLVADFFTDLVQPEALTRAEAQGLLPELWKATEELGFPLVGIDEDADGSGGSLRDLLVVLEAAGRSAAPLPLVETSLAAWLLATAGATVPSGPMAVVLPSARSALTLRDGRLSGTAADVGWARAAERLVVLVADETAAPQVALVDPAAARIVPGADLAGQPYDAVRFTDAPADVRAWPLPVESALARGALLRAAQMAGAVQEVSRLTREYVGQRVQFGQPVGRFQSVQQHVVTLAQAAVLSSLVVERAGLSATAGPGTFDPCAAKLVVDQNAAQAVRAAHQAHGAIGMTQEYRLQHFTRRLNAWRGDLGDEQSLALGLGAAVLREGSIARTITAPGGSKESTWQMT